MKRLTLLPILFFFAILQNCTLPGVNGSDEDLATLLTLIQVQSNSSQYTRWQSFPMTISATTTAPTKATSPDIDQAFWRRAGDSMEITYTYKHTNNTGATSGTGTYLFQIPDGYTIDSSRVVIDTFQETGAVGSASVFDDYVGSSKVYTTTALALFVRNGVAGGFVTGGSIGDLTGATVAITFNARVPITG